MKKIQKLYANVLLHLLVIKYDYLEIKHHTGMFIRSRLRILDLKLFPPVDISDSRLDVLDFEALETMTAAEGKAYANWIDSLREVFYKEEHESDFTPEFKKQLLIVKSLR